MRVPFDAAPAVQESFREVWQRLNQIDGPLSLDLKGRRHFNAGRAVDPFDYTTLDDVQKMVRQAVPAKADVIDLTKKTLYGTHTARLAKAVGVVPDGTFFFETDRAALYQASTITGTQAWWLIMCRPLRTSDGKPGDLAVTDAGFTWFDSVEGMTWRWSGNAWNYYIGSIVGAFSTRPDIALADRGVLFIASDHGYQVWRKGATAWVLLEGSGGPTVGALGSITGSLTANDAGYRYFASDYNREYRWTGSVWEDAPQAPARYQISYFAVAPDPAAGWAVCDGSGATRSTSTGGTAAYTTPNLITGTPVIRGAAAAGGTGGAATHTHAVDPGNTTSTGPNATVDVSVTTTTAAVASSNHTHDTDVASFNSGSASSFPTFYEAIPYIRL
jgi:hypothetical protein